MGENTGGVEINMVDSERPKRKNNLGLIIILVVLVLLIIGLAIGILVKKINDNKMDGVGESGGDIVIISDDTIILDDQEIDCSDPEIIYSQTNVDLCIQETYRIKNKDSNKVDEAGIETAVEKYDLAIKAAEEREDYYTAGFLIAARANFVYVYAGSCDEALRIFNEADLTDFPKDDLLGIYAQAISLAMECGNKALVQKWEGLYEATDN